MAYLGTISEFSSTQETWTAYVEHLRCEVFCFEGIYVATYSQYINYQRSLSQRTWHTSLNFCLVHTEVGHSIVRMDNSRLQMDKRRGSVQNYVTCLLSN